MWLCQWLCQWLCLRLASQKDFFKQKDFLINASCCLKPCILLPYAVSCCLNFKQHETAYGSLSWFIIKDMDPWIHGSISFIMNHDRLPYAVSCCLKFKQHETAYGSKIHGFKQHEALIKKSFCLKKSFCEASRRHSHWHSHWHSHTPTHSHSNSHSHVFCHVLIWGAKPPL